MNYQLIALDLDGTLLNSRKEVPEETVRAVREVSAAGKTVVFATGRAVPELAEQIALLPEVRYAVFASGAGLYDIHSRKAFGLHGLPYKHIRRILSLVRTKDVMPQIVLPDRDVIQASHMARLEDFDGLEYVGPEIPLTGTGETLRVATMAEEFPRAFLEAGEDVPSGFDLESLKLFANAGNYQLEFYYTVYNDIMEGLRSGAYDLAIGYLSDVYRDEVLDAGVLVSDLLDEIPVYFVEKTQKDISVALELE